MKFGAIVFILSMGLVPLYAQDNCNLKKDNEGVKVYLCENNDRAFKTIIVELEVPATLSQYAAKVLDVENYFQWQDRVKDQKIVKQVSDTELYYYSEVDVPWPATDRDYIFHLSMQQDPETKVINMTLIEMPDFLPRKEGFVRVPYANSLLTLTPISPNQVKVRYVLDVDPGGEVPAWLVNIFAANTPWNTYINFRKQIIEQGDNRIEVDFIQNY